MKIAVVGPSPVPFTRGGVETLLARLVETVNRHTTHAAELIKVPVREDSFGRTLQAYRRFARLDLTHFDLVISTKYPAWMVRHPRHLVYLQHRLRGVYDTYPGPTGWTAYFKEPPWRFAGAWMRAAIHLLDGLALRHGRIDHFFCISRTVQSRSEYFPPGTRATVVYHPPGLDRYECLPGRHFLTVSRLDAPKRIDLVIHALAYLRRDVPLVVVGDGPQRPYLETIAARDGRVVLTGMVSDEELRRLYAEAIGVVYVPYAEDYGLITIEAFRSGKPVITSRDAGGPLEFVEDGRTGLVTDAEPLALADAMERLLVDPERAIAMGAEGRRRVAGITWEATVSAFLDCYRWLEARPAGPVERRRVLLVSTFPLSPPRNGGQARLFHLYRELSRYWHVTALCMGYFGEPYRHLVHSPTFEEIVVQPTPEHGRRQAALERAAGGQPVFDVSLPQLARLTPLFGDILDHYLDISDVAISAHPYLWGLVRRRPRTRLLVYEAIDCEARQKGPQLGGTRAGRRLLAEVRSIEGRAAAESDLVLAVSEQVATELAALYGLAGEDTLIAANGARPAEPAGPGAVSQARLHLGLGERPVALFLAGWHPPNLEAFRFLIDSLAPVLPEVDFLVVGAVRDEYEKEIGPLAAPANVRALGFVSEELMAHALAAADLALNPVATGSGTNIKLLDYLAHGLPVVTTEIGARGLPLRDREHVRIASQAEFVGAIRALLADRWAAQDMGRRGAELVAAHFSWEAIARSVFEAVEERLAGRVAPPLDIARDDWLASGFWGLEEWLDPATGQTFPARWTTARAVMHVPNPRRPAVLELELKGGPGGSAAQLSQTEGDQVEVRLEEDWRPVRLPLAPRTGCDALEVVLTTPGWVPDELFASGDRRTLGVGVRAARLIETD